MGSAKSDSFQKFLDEKQYTLNGILRYEVIFGKDFISPGGLSTAKEFSAMLDLGKEDKVLDVGCGIGGSAFHMGKVYGADVIGIDLSTNMIAIANDRQKEYQIPKVQFQVADATTITYPAGTFSAIYSRDTILHIERKDLLFAEFFKWLKPGGKVVITDYACGSPEHHSQEFKEYVQNRGYHLLTVEQYGKILENAGFSKVKAEDKTEKFKEILRSELEEFDKKREEFLKRFSEEDYVAILSGWSDKVKRCERGDQKWGLFYAEKSY